VLAAQARKFLNDRKIPDEVIERNRIYTVAAWIPQLDGRYESIAFPFYFLGEAVHIKYRGPKDPTTGKKTFASTVGTERIFYGLDDLITIDPTTAFNRRAVEVAIIVEGEPDKLAMEVAGFRNAVSTPNGAPGKLAGNLDSYFSFLDNSNVKLNPGDKEGLLDSIRTFYIATDSDENGQRCEDELVRRLGPDRCRRVRWPKRADGQRIKDANDVLIELGPEAIVQAIEDAKPIPIDGVFTVADFEAELDDYYENGLPLGISVGWNALIKPDGTLGYSLKTGTTTLWTGWPQHGKSRFVENICVAAAREQGWKFAYFSPEVQPLQLHASYLAAQWAGEPFVSGNVSKMNREMYERAKKFLKNHFYFMMSDELPYGVDDLLERATKLVRAHGVNALVLDPWNNIYHARKSNEREDEYIGKAIQRINSWRRKYDCWVSIVAHPVKIRMERGKKQPIVTQHDVKGGSEWDAMMDFCMSIWRNIHEENTPTEIHVQKVKFQHLATLGMGLMQFDKPTARYYDIEGVGFGTNVKSKQVNPEDRPHFDSPPPDDYDPYYMKGPEWDTE
jgi:twinkle protein